MCLQSSTVADYDSTNEDEEDKVMEMLQQGSPRKISRSQSLRNKRKKLGKSFHCIYDLFT